MSDTQKSPLIDQTIPITITTTNSRNAVTVMTPQGDILVIGGVDDDVDTGTFVNKWDIRAQTWSSMPSLPYRWHSNFPATIVPRSDMSYRVVLVGGINDTISSAEEAAVMVYESRTQKWEERDVIPGHQRITSTSIAISDHQVLIAGGLGSTLRQETMVLYDVDSGSYKNITVPKYILLDVATLVTIPTVVSGVLCPDVLFFGCSVREDDTQVQSDQVLRYSVASDTWEPFSQLPRPGPVDVSFLSPMKTVEVFYSEHKSDNQYRLHVPTQEWHQVVRAHESARSCKVIKIMSAGGVTVYLRERSPYGRVRCWR